MFLREYPKLTRSMVTQKGLNSVETRAEGLKMVRVCANHLECSSKIWELYTRDSQVTFINHLNCTELFHMNWSQSSAITWFHRLGRLLLIVGEPKCKLASSILKEELLPVSAGTEKFCSFIQAG